MKILKWIVALPFIALALFIVARFVMCRPDGEVVRVATPMVEKIADYIVKHGVPESLEDIPDLPYGFDECKVSVKYEKKIGDNFIKVASENEADYILHEQSCSFRQKDRTYRVWLWFEKLNNTVQGRIRIQSDKTCVCSSLKKEKNFPLVHDKPGSGFDRRFGFCKQFKM